MSYEDQLFSGLQELLKWFESHDLDKLTEFRITEAEAKWFKADLLRAFEALNNKETQ